jgi:hypothetical protein
MDVKYIWAKIFLNKYCPGNIVFNLDWNIKPLSLKGIESKITILLGM